MKIKISGTIIKIVTQKIRVPFPEKEIEIAEHLVKGNKIKKKFLKEIVEQFPKGSEINVEVIKDSEKTNGNK